MLHAEYDLTRTESIERTFDAQRPEMLVHLAAVVGGIGATRANPGRFFYDNAVIGIQLIEAARRGAKKRWCWAGSARIRSSRRCPLARMRFGKGILKIRTRHGIAKSALLVQRPAYRQQYGMNAIYLLPVNLYGPKDNFREDSSHVIPALIKKSAEAVKEGREEIVLWGDGSPTREFLYVDDAAQAIAWATKLYDQAEPVNLGSGVEISIRDLAVKIATLIGFTGRMQWDTTKPNGQPRRSLDVSRAQRAFGFQARTSLEDGLRKTIEWYRATSGSG